MSEKLRKQHDFRPTKFIIPNLLIVSDSTIQFGWSKSVDVIHLDFSKTFERVSKRHFLLKLQHVGTERNLLRPIDRLTLSSLNRRSKLFYFSVNLILHPENRSSCSIWKTHIINPSLHSDPIQTCVVSIRFYIRGYFRIK